MLRRSLVRIVVSLALSMLLVCLFSGVKSVSTERLVKSAWQIADKAKSSFGLSGIDEENWDGLTDFRPLLARLELGDKRFDWSEWLDLDKTKLYDTNDLDRKLYPYLRSLNLAQRPIMPYERTTSPQEQAMIGRLYCKWLLTAPSRVVAIRNPMLHTPPGDNEYFLEYNYLASTKSLRSAPLVSYEVMHESSDLRHRQYGHSEATPFSGVSEPLVKDLKASTVDLNLEDLLFPRIEDRLFTWNAQQLIDEHKKGVLDHALTIRACLEYNRDVKHFHEVCIRDDPVRYGVHYDWRFFRGILPHKEHVASLHALARTWQQFSEQMGVVYWYAHGSLTGHVWNAMAMPWDADHDVQMPVAELDRLARDFNRTLVVQDTREGFRKYLIDVNPEYVVRTHGPGKNVIDARFIDVDTGLYVDITGLARITPDTKLVSCKNRHQYRTSDFLRLRRTKFEGYSALVPADTHQMLHNEYPSYENPTFNHWQFVQGLRLWEYRQSCEEYLKMYKESRHVYCFPRDIQSDDGCEAEFGTCDRETMRTYELTENITALAVEESALYKEIPNPLTVSDWSALFDTMERLLEVLGKYTPPALFSTALFLNEPVDQALSENSRY